MRRWLRCLVCLLVICALLINLSPLRVNATGVTAGGVVVGVGITVAVAVCLQALGVGIGSDSSDFNQVVSACADALSSKFAVDGLVSFLFLTQDGVGKTYASANFLQAILDWFWGDSGLLQNGLVTTSYTCTAGTYGFGTYYSSDPFMIVYSRCGSYVFTSFISNFSNSIKYKDRENYGTGSFGMNYGSYGSSFYSYGGYRTATAEEIASIDVPYVGHGIDENCSSVTDHWQYLFDSVYPSLLNGVSTTEDLTLESVGTDVDTDYKTYVDTGIVDEDDIPYVPVTIPSLGTDTFVDQSQAEAQAGTTAQEIIDQLVDAESVPGTDSGAITVPETVTLKDILTGILSVPKSIAQAISTFFADVVAAVQAIPAAIADIFTVKGEVGSFTISLSDYFPFCIPFDLYDFLSCLNADPVAPVIDWEIPLPGGSAYPMQVDLSAWDDVAQLLRRLQLLLFCVGLAFKTRDLIKG